MSKPEASERKAGSMAGLLLTLYDHQGRPHLESLRLNLIHSPHSEERRGAARLEGWATDGVRVPTLRDAHCVRSSG